MIKIRNRAEEILVDSKNRELINEIYKSIEVVVEAEMNLMELVYSNQLSSFLGVVDLLTQLIDNISSSCRNIDTTVFDSEPAILSIIHSLENVLQLMSTDTKKAQHKLEFELIPLTQEFQQSFYFWNIASNDEKLLEEYYKTDIHKLGNNKYIEKSLKTGEWKYDLSIVVTGYNKLEYTQECIRYLMKYYPKDLKTELILINHGSEDETLKFFESIKPDKILDVKVNGGGSTAIYRILEGKYMVGISNDVFVQKDTIINMYNCMISDPEIGYIVPTTPNVSNYQTIPCSYSNLEELEAFAEKNNISNSDRWERRQRLCNPIAMLSAETLFKVKSAYQFISTNSQSFPDDKISLLCRRNGYKMYLCKDAFCHHCGSVTLKDENKTHSLEAYEKGRIAFKNRFGIDPWVKMCHEFYVIKELKYNKSGHISILSIDGGLGSTGLKIKEEYKERNSNKDVFLKYVLTDNTYYEDVKNLGNELSIIKRYEDLENEKVKYDYIIIEGIARKGIAYERLLQSLMKISCPNATLIVEVPIAKQQYVGNLSIIKNCNKSFVASNSKEHVYMICDLK